MTLTVVNEIHAHFKKRKKKQHRRASLGASKAEKGGFWELPTAGRHWTRRHPRGGWTASGESGRIPWWRAHRGGQRDGRAEQGPWGPQCHTHLEALILTAVQLLLVGRLLGADEGGVLRPGGEGHPGVIQHLRQEETPWLERQGARGQRALLCGPA